MWKAAKKQHTPIPTGLRALETYRDREVEVVPVVVGQRAVKEKKWVETFKIFGIGKEENHPQTRLYTVQGA